MEQWLHEEEMVDMKMTVNLSYVFSSPEADINH